MTYHRMVNTFLYE